MPVHDPRLEAEKKRREEKIAASRASASPIQQRPPMQAQGGMGPSRPSPLAQAGIGIGKKLLGSALGPLGGVLGGLFNTGGPVQGYSRGGEVEDKRRKEREKKKREAKARGEYEVADWFYEGGDKTDRRYPGHFGATSPDDKGAGWVWRNEPNYKLKEFYEDMAIPGEEHRARFKASQYTPQALQASGPSGKYISTDRPFNVDMKFDPSGKGSALSALVADPLEQGFYNPEDYDLDTYLAKRKDVLGYNTGGRATAKKRTVFVPDPSSPFGVKQTAEVYNDKTGRLAPKRAPMQQAAQVDTYEGIAAAIAADKAAGRPVDYNKLAALQQARANQNRAAQDATRQQYLKKNPEFRFPGGSQGVIKRNMGGPISMYGYNKGGKAADKRPWWQRMLDRNPTRRAGMNVGGMVPQGPLNPNGYNEGGPVAPTPIKKVMDEDKIEIQRETFERAEARKDMKFQLDEKRAAEKHAMDMKLKKATAVTKKAPLAKK